MGGDAFRHDATKRIAAEAPPTKNVQREAIAGGPSGPMFFFTIRDGASRLTPLLVYSIGLIQ